MNAACSFQSGCSRVLVDPSRFGPADEITTNVCIARQHEPGTLTAQTGFLFQLNPASPGCTFGSMAAKSAVVVPNSNARTLLISIAVLMSVCIASLLIAGAT